MKYALGNMLNGAGGLNADGLSLDLQFATDKTLTARKGPTPTFTRASSGTFVGSNGLIQSAAINAPRFDHDPVTGICKGLLIEESRTNVALYSGAIVVGTGWGSVEATSFVDAVGPNNQNAYLISETSATSNHTIFNSGSITSSPGASIVNGTSYAGSIFVKKVAGSVDWVQLLFAGAIAGSTAYANFNINTGTVGNYTGLAIGTIPKIESYADGWYRISAIITATATSAASANLILAGINNTNGTTRAPSYAGNTSNQFLASLAQFEAGSFPTSYIPTVAASGVRSADVCSISGAGFTGMWNALEGSLLTSVIFNAPVTYGITQFLVDINDGTNANRLSYYRLVSTGRPEFSNTSNSSLNVQITGSTALQPFVLHKYSAGFKLDDYAFYVNNSQIGTDNLGAMIVSPTILTIGDASAGTTRQYINGTISSLRYYRKRLSNAKLASLTV